MGNKISSLYEFGKFRFDSKTHNLWRDGEPVSLSPKASELLALLLERNGEFVSKDEIFATVWAETFVEDGVLTQNIYTLRKVLGTNEDGSPLIENRTRQGYRITVPVQLTAQSSGNQLVGDIESEEQDSNAPPAKIRKGNIAALIAGAILLLTAGLLGYRFFRTPEGSRDRINLETIRFQKIGDTGNINFPTLAPDGNLAAFKKGGSGGVYVKDLRTSVETKLEIPNVKLFGYLRFSQDGESLYFRNRSAYVLPADLFKVSRYGGEAKLIAQNVWSAFSFSSDEKQLAFVRNFPNQNRQALIIKNLDSGTETEVMNLESPEAFYLWSYPAWSPDDKKLLGVVTRQNQGFQKIAVADLETGQVEDWSFKNFHEVSQIAWLPKRNALIASAVEDKVYQLREISYPDKQIRRLTNDLNNYMAPVISADGAKVLATQFNLFANIWVLDSEVPAVQKQLTFGTTNLHGYYGIDYFPDGQIVYASNEGESTEVNLWRVDPNNNQRRQLTVNAGKRNESPTVSADGRFVYFSSNRSGKPSIWSVDANGENPHQVTSAENSSDLYPQISPANDWLYFVRKSSGSSAVWRKSLADGREEKITDEHSLTPNNFLALSPDGRHLAFQNLTEKVPTDDPTQTFQIAVVETDKVGTVKFFSLDGRKVEVFWTADSAAFDSIDPTPGGDRILRTSLNRQTPGEVLRDFPKEQLFGLSRAPDGKTFAAARGEIRYDAILLTY